MVYFARPATPPAADAGEAVEVDDLADDGLAEEADTDTDSTTELAPLNPLASADEPQLQAWLARIVHQDEAALDALYRACVGRVYGLALRVVRNPAIAEEVTEDTFWQVWRQAPRFDPARGTSLAWLLTIARSRALDALRARRRVLANTVSVDALGEAMDSLVETADTGNADPHDLLEAVQSNQQLHLALAQLDAVPRQLVALAFFKGLTHEEIASQIGLPLGTVKSHLRRAILALRKCLGPQTSPACPSAKLI